MTYRINYLVGTKFTIVEHVSRDEITSAQRSKSVYYLQPNDSSEIYKSHLSDKERSLGLAFHKTRCSQIARYLQESGYAKVSYEPRNDDHLDDGVLLGNASDDDLCAILYLVEKSY